MSRFTEAQLAAISAHLPTGKPMSELELPPSPKNRKNEESQMQRNLMKWWHHACNGFGIHEWLLFSIPNGGGGGMRRGHWMKLEGSRKGCPDIVLCVPRGQWQNVNKSGVGDSFWVPQQPFTALFIELKTPTGRLSPEQKTYHALLVEQGYRVAVPRSLDEAVKEITEYLT